MDRSVTLWGSLLRRDHFCGRTSPPQFEKKTSLKSEKKYKNHKQAEYHHTLKGRKTLSSGGAGDSNLGPLVYEASVLPTELSFRMKN